MPLVGHVQRTDMPLDGSNRYETITAIPWLRAGLGGWETAADHQGKTSVSPATDKAMDMRRSCIARPTDLVAQGEFDGRRVERTSALSQ